MIVPVPTVESLDVVPAHSSIPEVERWIFPGIPNLVSVHAVDAAEKSIRHYCQAHLHADVDELNLFIGLSPDFRFSVRIGDECHVVGPHAAAFVRAGLMHSANVISGSGYLVVHHFPAVERVATTAGSHFASTAPAP